MIEIQQCFNDSSKKFAKFSLLIYNSLFVDPNWINNLENSNIDKSKDDSMLECTKLARKLIDQTVYWPVCNYIYFMIKSKISLLSIDELMVLYTACVICKGYGNACVEFSDEMITSIFQFSNFKKVEEASRFKLIKDVGRWLADNNTNSKDSFIKRESMDHDYDEQEEQDEKEAQETTQRIKKILDSLCEKEIIFQVEAKINDDNLNNVIGTNVVQLDNFRLFTNIYDNLYMPSVESLINLEQSKNGQHENELECYKKGWMFWTKRKSDSIGIVRRRSGSKVETTVAVNYTLFVLKYNTLFFITNGEYNDKFICMPKYPYYYIKFDSSVTSVQTTNDKRSHIEIKYQMYTFEFEVETKESLQEWMTLFITALSPQFAHCNNNNDKNNQNNHNSNDCGDTKIDEKNNGKNNRKNLNDTQFNINGNKKHGKSSVALSTSKSEGIIDSVAVVSDDDHNDSIKTELTSDDHDITSKAISLSKQDNHVQQIKRYRFGCGFFKDILYQQMIGSQQRKLHSDIREMCDSLYKSCCQNINDTNHDQDGNINGSIEEVRLYKEKVNFVKWMHSVMELRTTPTSRGDTGGLQKSRVFSLIH